MLVLTAASCSGPSTERVDREAYLAVLADPSAGSRCAEIEDRTLGAECVALAALAQAEAGALDPAHGLCQSLEAGSWRDECHFLACDGARLTGRDAVHCCKSAGQFRRRCVGHAMSRDAMTAFEAVPLGEESAGLAAVESVIARYQGPGVARHKAEQIVRAALLERAPAGPLTAAVCGDIGTELCAQVYEEMLRQATKPTIGSPELGLRSACGSRVDRERVEALGLPSWEPALDAVAQQAWTRICRR